MLDPMLPWRLAQMTGEMLLRQTTASMQMWGELATRGAEVAQAVSKGAAAEPPRVHRTVRSWYRHPDPEPTPLLPAWLQAPPWSLMSAALGQPPAPSASLPWTFPVMPAAPGAMTPWQPWLRLWSQSATLQTWPMAMMLMAAGVPRGAAWPAAEAGAHMMAASAKAAEGLEQMFSSYRSAGGHASAQIIPPRRLH